MPYRFLLAAAVLILAGCATTGAPRLADASGLVSETETIDEETLKAADEENEQQMKSASIEEQRANGDRIICKRRIITGSRFQKRVCLTWSQWQEIEQNSRSLGREIQRVGGHSDPHDPGLSSGAFTGKD